MLKKNELDALGELLRLACADNNQQTREDLQHALDWASDISKLKEPPVGVYVEIEADARRLQAAIRQLDDHPDYWFNPPDGWQNVTSGMSEKLGAIIAKAQAQKSKRGQPPKMDKLAIVHFALGFFLEHSDRSPSTDFNNPFRKFAEAFYRAAIGCEIKGGGLDHHIRTALKQHSGG
jgi:hypothetical protein